MRSSSTLSLATSNNAGTEIHRWTSALPASAYLVSATNIEGVELWRRWWPAEILAEAGDWLAAQAASGILIAARPWSTAHLLVRGLRPEAYARLATEHHIAAAVPDGAGFVEAWISIARRPVDARVAARTAALIAARHGGDLPGADARSIGSLPGLRRPAASGSGADAPTVTRLLTAARRIDPKAAAIATEAAAALGCPLIWSPFVTAAKHPAARRATSHVHPRYQRPTVSRAQRGRR